MDLECESSIGSVFASVLECEAEFELVDIQCTIDDAALENCKSNGTLKNRSSCNHLMHSGTRFIPSYDQSVGLFRS